MIKNADWVGWLAGLILLATVGAQVFTQWKAGTIKAFRDGFSSGRSPPLLALLSIVGQFETGCL